MTKTNGAYHFYLTHPRAQGWRNRPCSQCGVIHPADCYVGRDPEFKRLMAEEIKD